MEIILTVANQYHNKLQSTWFNISSTMQELLQKRYFIRYFRQKILLHENHDSDTFIKTCYCMIASLGYQIQILLLVVCLPKLHQKFDTCSICMMQILHSVLFTDLCFVTLSYSNFGFSFFFHILT